MREARLFFLGEGGVFVFFSFSCMLYCRNVLFVGVAARRRSIILREASFARYEFYIILMNL